MASIEFSWDPDKANANRRKHGVAFEEAQTVFLDENARLIHDPDHSAEEDRFLLLGLSERLRTLIVCHWLSRWRRDHSNHFGAEGDRQGTPTVRGLPVMRKEYDFTGSRKNPYAKILKKQITIRLEADTIDYFKKLAVETGIPYQNLINLFLRECAQSQRKLAFR